MADGDMSQSRAAPKVVDLGMVPGYIVIVARDMCPMQKRNCEGPRALPPGQGRPF